MVIHDFMASNSNELTVRRGQTVEVLERCHDRPDWCLVRTTDRSPALEGLVPCSMLCIAHSRSSMEMEGIFNHKGTACKGGKDACFVFKDSILFRYFVQVCVIKQILTPACLSQTLCQCAAMTPSCQGRPLRSSLVITASAPTPHQGLNDQVQSHVPH